MATVSPVGNLGSLNTPAPEALGTPPVPAGTPHAGTANARVGGGFGGISAPDQFTTSNVAGLQSTAQAAGLFTVAQPAAFTPATNALLSQPPPPAANPPAANGPAANAGAATPGSPTVQSELQALNNSLQALGLTPSEISEIDRIAAVTNNFNATAFSSLAHELLARSQNAARQTGVAPANTVGVVPASGATLATAIPAATKAATAK